MFGMVGPVGFSFVEKECQTRFEGFLAAAMPCLIKRHFADSGS
jgi:hypothetical protein